MISVGAGELKNLAWDKYSGVTLLDFRRRSQRVKDLQVQAPFIENRFGGRGIQSLYLFEVL